MKHWTSCPSLGKYASKNECPDKLSAVMLDLGIKPWFLDVKAQATQYLTILHMYSISLIPRIQSPDSPLYIIYGTSKSREKVVFPAYVRAGMTRAFCVLLVAHHS
jgi:hypothetical protein